MDDSFIGFSFNSFNIVGKALILYDAAFDATNENNAYGYTIYFDNFLVFVGVFKGCRSASAKEAETRVILYAVTKTCKLDFQTIVVAWTKKELLMQSTEWKIGFYQVV